MKVKKLFSGLLLLCMLLPIAFSSASAAGSVFCYIDGENITRSVDTAVVYTGISSTGQSQWGQNIVADADGKITKIIEGGDSAGADLAIPEGGMVISASGTRIKWFTDNARVGKYVFYDRFASKLFIYDGSGMFDPYYSESFSAYESENGYILTSSEFEGIPQYSYKIYVDGSGTVVPEDSGDESGFTVEAGTRSDMILLRMYAPVGAKCVYANGKISLSYDSKMLSRSVTLSLSAIKSEYALLCDSFADIDRAGVDALISAAETAAKKTMNYRETVSLIESFSQITDLFSPRIGSELRSALYTPIETSDEEVYALLKKVASAGLNGISLRLTNGYGSFLLLPSDAKFTQDEKFAGFDVLSSYVKYCGELGLSLDVCVSVYYNEYASAAEPSWLTSTSGSDEGVKAKFFSPASDGFSEYFVSYIGYLVSHYDIDSLSLDYIRYPRFSESCDYGYDDETKTKFSEQYGIDMKSVNTIAKELYRSEYWTKWVEFRRSLVSGMVSKVSSEVRSIRKNLTITAYVSRDIVDYYYMQDSKAWLDNGWVDGITLALFDYDSKENDALNGVAYRDSVIAQKSSVYSGYASGGFYFAALNSDTDLSGSELAKLIGDSRISGAQGFIFSNLDSFFAQNYPSALQKSVMAESSISPLSDTGDAISSLLSFAEARLNGRMLEYGCFDEATAANAKNAISDYRAKLQANGIVSSDADALYSTEAALFASSGAKNTVMSDFAMIKKLASLYSGSEDEPVIPPVSSDETADQSDISDTPESTAGAESAASSSIAVSSENDGRTGEILVYCFVGLAFAVGVAFAVIGIRRRKKK